MEFTKTFYACKTDWIHEFGETDVRFFDNVEALKKFYPCVEDCGIVEIDMKATVIQEGR
jgi:hypothetical protein